MDTLRVAAIAGVIVVHTATAYVTDIADWYYDDELRSSPLGLVLFAVPALLGGVFGLGPLFWLAGWFSVRALQRAGPPRFTLDRLVRLGVPVAVFVLLVNPLADLVGNLRQEDLSFVDYLRQTEFAITWFVVALVFCSGGYALVRAISPARRGRPPGTRTFVAAAVVIAVLAVAVWPVFSLLDEHLMSLRPGAWIQGAVLFTLGVLSAEGGEAGDEPVPVIGRRAERWWGWATVLGGLAVSALVASSGPEQLDDLFDDRGWLAIGFATAYGLVWVSFSLWCLAWFRRRWCGELRWVRPAGRASYATYLLHPLVLTSVMMGLSWLSMPPEAKFVLVTVLAVPLSFAVGHLLTTMPGLRRVL